MRRSEIHTVRIESAADRLAAMEVIADVYLEEKRWIHDVEAEISLDGAAQARTSWFLARVGRRPAGVIRLTYDPPLEAPPELAFRFEQGVDLAALASGCRFADVGRFMIVPRYRRQIRVALSLMRTAVEEVVARGYSHLITDVFESDPHSPLAFHTRVLGFQRIGTHRYGELACDSVRVILVLDIQKSYARLKQRRHKVFRFLTAGLQERLEGLGRAAPAPQPG